VLYRYPTNVYDFAIWEETRAVHLETGSDQLLSERLIPVNEDDLIRYAREPRVRPLANTVHFRDAADEPLSYGYNLKVPADPRDVAMAWVAQIAHGYRLTPKWRGRRSHVVQAYDLNPDFLEREVYKKPLFLDPRDVRSQADTIVELARALWEQTVRSACRREGERS
jgi:hypothetical protein